MHRVDKYLNYVQYDNNDFYTGGVFTETVPCTVFFRSVHEAPDSKRLQSVQKALTVWFCCLEMLFGL